MDPRWIQSETRRRQTETLSLIACLMGRCASLNALRSEPRMREPTREHERREQAWLAVN